MKRTSLTLIALSMFAVMPPARAQHHDHAASPAVTPQVDPHAGHAAPATTQHDHAPAERTAQHDTHAHHATASAPSAVEAPREPIPPLTDADRAAAFPVLHPHAMAHGASTQFYVLFDRLETWDADPGSGQAWEANAWIGGDVNRLWLRSEGERAHGHTESADLEALYGRAISPWWDAVAGVKHTFVPDAGSRTQLAFGVQGLAPYKFEISATGYLDDNGRLSATAEAEYELLLTNQLILQPHVEAHWASREDGELNEGAGLVSAEASLRLRYEFTRRFAPYVGVSHERLFGDTADAHAFAGESRRDTRFVAGLRFWF